MISLVFSVGCTCEIGYIVPPDDTVQDLFFSSVNIVLSYYCLPTSINHPTAGVSNFLTAGVLQP